MILHSFGTGDHRIITVDFNLRDAAGYRVKIYYPEIRRLIGDNKLVAEKYDAKVLELLTFYDINKKLDKLENNWDSLEELRRVAKPDMINEQVTRLLLCTKKECRKLRTGEVNFFLEISKVVEI